MSTPPRPVPARTLRSARALAAAGLVAEEDVAALTPVQARFAVAVSPEMAAAVGGPPSTDPIARQFIPTTAELRVSPVERADPIGDAPFTTVAGLTHRYPDRVLLKPLHVCPVYCRFCFRREQVGPGGEVLKPAQLDAALDYIARHEAVWEVILTGGDPLALAPKALGDLLARVAAIPHVQVLRIHTRVPVVSPSRVSAALLDALSVDKPVWIGLHTNHAQELTPAARAAIGRLADAGHPLVSQTVLLAGVNDSVSALEELFRALVTLRVKPYYLHHGDLAEGTGHFRTSIEEGQRLVEQLRGRLSGLCQPTYVLDLPGGHGKVPVGPAWLEGRTASGAWRVRDMHGRVHTYPPPPIP